MENNWLKINKSLNFSVCDTTECPVVIDLQAENKRLKAMTGVYSVRLMEKYKQALEEIREIGEKEIYMKQNASMNEIIRKINEVLND